MSGHGELAPVAPPTGADLIARWCTGGFLLSAAIAWGVKIAGSGGSGATAQAVLVATGIGAVFAAIAAVAQRGRSGWLDGWRLPLILVGLTCFPAVYERVGGDGFEYYALMHSVAFDHDLDFENDFAGLKSRQVMSAGGEPAPRFPMGTAIFWTPVVLLVHAVITPAVWLGANIAPDGFSPPYQAAATTATFLYAFLALLLLEAELRERHGPALALLTVLATWLATPLHFYMVATPSMSHGISMCACTLFVLAWLRARKDDAARAWAVASIAGGLMVVVRGQDAVLLMLPIADLAWRRGLQGWRAASIVVSGPILMLGLQLALWWGVYGPTFPQEVRRGGNLLAMTPHVADYLLSARHGLDRTLIHGGFGAGEVWLQPARAAVLGDAARNRRRVSRLGRRGRSRLDHLASARPLGAASYGQ